MTMEEIGEDYLTELIFQNMIQVVETNDAGRVKTCRVHDIMRKIAMTTSEEEEFCASFETSDESFETSKIQLKLEGKTRRLSLYNNRGINIRLSRKMAQQLRSFFVFQTDMCSSFSLNVFSSKFKFLRVLDLEGVIVEILPSSLVDLFNLRYLNLRETKIQELPNSMDRLMNLQTLDIRNTNVRRVPDEISKLQKLRHLYMYTEDSNLLCSMKGPKGIWNARSLQTLARVEAEEELIKHVPNLTELKRLEITGIKSVHGSALCVSIQMLTSLCILGLTSISDEEELGLEVLSRPPFFLQKLTLVGRLKKMPPCIGYLTNLTHLYLGSSQVEENILSSLHLLTTLVLLELKKAYNGKVLHFNAEWFPRLNKLKLLELRNLEMVKFEENTLPSIKEFHLHRCPELNSFPEGIGHLMTIQELHLEEMSEDFVRKLRSFASGKMQTEVRYIPSISLVYSTGQTRVVEML